MPTDYSYMDDWTGDQILTFKEEAKDKQLSQIESISRGIFEFRSNKVKLVAEGDSWFDYLPGTDLIDCLRAHHGYYIKTYAKAGDTLENMIYGTEFDNNFQRTPPSINKVLRKLGQLKPNIFLFSGGGNDIAGDEFASYLNHKNSNLPPLRNEYIENMIFVNFKKYFQDLLGKVAAVSSNTNIISHGYGHTIPTGKGVGLFGVSFSGPWLRPALAMKGIFDHVEQQEAVKVMINHYNEMLIELANENDSFFHIDLRNVLDPFTDWSNELHLKNSAYALVAEMIHEKIVEIGS